MCVHSGPVSRRQRKKQIDRRPQVWPQPNDDGQHSAIRSLSLSKGVQHEAKISKRTDRSSIHVRDSSLQHTQFHGAGLKRTSPGGTASDEASNGATLTGRVTLAGQAPKNHSINMAADSVCSKSHSGAAMSEEVVTGADNAVANVLVYVSDGVSGRTSEAPNHPAVIEQKGCQYRPHVIAVEAGQK